MAGKLGSGSRFQGLERRLAKRGARNPAALAAYIGRRAYGAKRFEELAEAGKRRAEHEREHKKRTHEPARRARV